jgi:hypothetical protein
LMSLDRTICAAGCKAYVRPLVESDHPQSVGSPSGRRLSDKWILVKELQDRVRSRVSIDLPRLAQGERRAPT